MEPVNGLQMKKKKKIRKVLCLRKKVFKKAFCCTERVMKEKRVRNSPANTKVEEERGKEVSH